MLRERKVICVGTEQSVRTITIGEVMNYTHYEDSVHLNLFKGLSSE